MRLAAKNGPTTLVGRVYEDLRSRIESAELQTGLRLPSYKALAIEYSVSVITIQAAILRLATAGYVQSRPRSGVFVSGAWRSFGDAATGLGWRRPKMLQTAIAVLSPSLGDTQAYHRESGWASVSVVGAIHEIQRNGYHVFALNPEQLDSAMLSDLVADGLFGVVAPMQSMNGSYLLGVNMLRDSGLHVVACNDYPQLSDYDSVDSDHEAGGYQLTRWLIDRGCRRPLMVWSRSTIDYWLYQREAGYRQAMAEAGLQPLDPLIWYGQAGQYVTAAVFDGLARSLGGYLIESICGANPVDALMLDSDGNCYKAAAAIRYFGKRPGLDVAIVGYDNYWADMPDRVLESSDPIATVDKLNMMIGTEAVRLLLQRKDGQVHEATIKRRIAPVLIETAAKKTTRESGAGGE